MDNRRGVRLRWRLRNEGRRAAYPVHAAYDVGTPVNIFGARSTDPGYVASSTGVLLDHDNANTQLLVNAKVFVPTGTIKLFASNPTVAVVRGGVVAYRLDLAASAAADEFVISAPGGSTAPAPPFRTVQITTRGRDGSAAENSVVATISNYSPFTVLIKGWRTG